MPRSTERVHDGSAKRSARSQISTAATCDAASRDYGPITKARAGRRIPALTFGAALALALLPAAAATAAEPDHGDHHHSAPHPHPHHHAHPRPGHPGSAGHHDHGGDAHHDHGENDHRGDDNPYPHYDPNGFGPHGHWRPEDRPSRGGWVDPHRNARFDPARGHGRYVVGERLAWNYHIAPLDWRARGLWAPPRGYYWAQVDRDFVLASIGTGLIASVLPSDEPIPPPPLSFPPPETPYASTGARIVNSSGACLDVQRGDTAPGTAIILFHCHGSPNQSWVVGNDHIVGDAGGCLDIQGGVGAPGAGAVLNSCNGARSQQWSLQNGAIVGIGDLCLGGPDGGGGDRTSVVLAPCNGTPPQQWTVQ